MNATPSELAGAPDTDLIPGWVKYWAKRQQSSARVGTIDLCLDKGFDGDGVAEADVPMVGGGLLRL